MSAEWDVAAEDFTKSASDESYKNDANYNLAICRMQLGEYDAAVEAIDLDGIAANPENAAPTMHERRGSVSAKAEPSISMGVDEEGEPKDGGWPVAVSVATVEASANVQKGAVIEAAKDVTIASKSVLKVGTRASSGLAGAPAAAAVAVLTNDVHIAVNGNVTAAQREEGWQARTPTRACPCPRMCCAVRALRPRARTPAAGAPRRA